MACFLVPTALAIVTSIIQKTAHTLAEKLKLGILNALLWGGVIVLMVEHVWHGEIVPWPPYLTAMANPANIPIMLHEMATIGTVMSAVIASTWTAIVMLTGFLMPKIATLKEVKHVKKPLTQLK